MKKFKEFLRKNRIFVAFASLAITCLASIPLFKMNIMTLNANTISAPKVGIKESNSYSVDFESGDSQYRAYPSNGVDKFVIYISGAFSSDILKYDLKIYYRTFDITAVAGTGDNLGDYTAKSGVVEFKAGDHYHDTYISVPVQAATYAIYSVGNFTSGNYTAITDSKTYSATSHYNTRYFGVEIYKIEGEGASLHTYTNSSGKNYKSDKAYGTLPANHYLPYGYNPDTETYELAYYSDELSVDLSDVACPRGGLDISKYNIKSTNYGSQVSKDIIQTGLGHYYFNANGRHDGSDMSQRNSYCGLVYDGWNDDTKVNSDNFNDWDSMVDWNRGVVTIELDGYPAPATGYECGFNLGAYRCGDYSNTVGGEDSLWDGDTYQFAKYRITVKDRTNTSKYLLSSNTAKDDAAMRKSNHKYSMYAYRVENDPDWLGLGAGRNKYGEKRKLIDCHMNVYIRDDSPITIKNLYIEDTSNFYKTQDDTLKIMVRFSEPCQIVGDAPVLKCKVNYGSTLHDFKYVGGNGSDTFCFEIALSELASVTEIISSITAMEIDNASSIVDFSSPEAIYTVAKKSNEEKYSGSITKESDTRYSLNDTYSGGKLSGIGSLTLKLDPDDDGVGVIDPRTPEIQEIKCSDATTSATTHEVKINISNYSDSYTIYKAWTTDLTLTEDIVIDKPKSYTETIPLEKNKTSVTTKATGLNGMVYLWVKVESKFGKVDERVCGPFYFDNTPDDVSNIKVVNNAGTEIDAFSSPSKTKNIQFTISHANDYITCSGQDLTSKDGQTIGFKQLNLVWGTDSILNSESATINSSPLFLYTSPNYRGLEVVNEETVDSYVYSFGMSDDQSANTTSKATKDDFIKTTNGVKQTKSYTVSRTYQITLGYDEDPDLGMNDFNLSEGDNINTHFGFITYDGLGNVKSIDSNKFKSDYDYIGSKYANFDTRNVIGATIEYNQEGNKVYDVLSRVSQSDSSVDSNVHAFLGNGSERISYSFKLDQSGYLEKNLLGIDNKVIQVVVKKPNTTLTNDDVTGLGTITNNYVFTGEEVYEAEKEYETPWFTYKITGLKTVGGTEVYTEIQIVSKSSEDCDDLYGYYDVSFIFIDNANLLEPTKNTPSASYYLGTGSDNTDNVENINDGKLFINSVYRLDEGVKYYYMDSQGGVHEESYCTSGQPTFSSEDYAKEYVKFMEYQDFYLVQIATDADAESLNVGQGSMVRAKEDRTISAAKGQYWIRYKADGWTIGSKQRSSWVYYYYADANSNTTTINISDISDSLSDAVDTVVATILKGNNDSSVSKNVILTSNGGLDAYGSPNISKNSVHYDALSVDESKMGSVFATPVTFSGDSRIYDANITYYDSEYDENVNFQLASNVVLEFDSYTNIYITPYDEPYYGYYGKIASKSGKTIKQLIDDAYSQVYTAVTGKTSESVSAPSGRYMLLEIGKNGINYTYIYIDKTAPQLNFEYQINSLDNDGNIISVTSSQYYTNDSASDHAINATSITITGIGTDNAKDLTTAVEEIDYYAYIAIYNSSKTSLLYTRSAYELRLKSFQLRTQGDYVIEVYDRSGNHYDIPLSICSSDMIVKINTDNDVVINIDGRDEDQIKEFEVKLNNQVIDTKFETSKRYTESGQYEITILDWYGTTYTNSFIFQRTIPEVTWYAINGTTTEKIKENSQYAKIDKVSDTEYNILTGSIVAFRYNNDLATVHEFTNGVVDESKDFTVYSTSYLEYTQTSIFEYSVKFTYSKYKNVYVVYNVIIDTQAPEILVSYDSYSFEHTDEMSATLKLNEMIENGEEISNGQRIDPDRIDYSLSSTTTINIPDGASVNTNLAKLKINDVSGISKLEIKLNNKTIYSGDYIESGLYPTSIEGVYTNYNELKEYGEYIITAYDKLYNKTVFTFTNTSNYDVRYYVDGEEISATYDYVYQLDANGEQVLDENGNPIELEKWLYLLKFDGSKTVEAIDKFDTQVYDRETKNFTYVQYGNTSQKVRISQEATITYLLTYNDQKYYASFYYNKGQVYLSLIYADIEDDDITVGNSISESPIITKADFAINGTCSAYVFEELNMVINATYNSLDNYVEFTINASDIEDSVVIVETKVSSPDGIYEPAYFKTALSKYPTVVNIYNDKGLIDLEDYATGEWVYINGEKLFIKEDEVSEYVQDIQIAYSSSLGTGSFKYIYSINPILDKDLYKYEDEDGYYVLKITNRFGISSEYQFALSNGLMVSTISSFLDGFEEVYEKDYTGTIYSNQKITITFKSKNTDFTLTKNGSVYSYEPILTSGSYKFEFTEKATYQLVISDIYGNEVIRDLVINTAALSLPEDAITGFNEDALRRSENFTNTKTTINTYFFNSKNIKYVEITHGDNVQIIYDDISTTNDKVAFDELAFINSIGNDGDGLYQITFRNIYGDVNSINVYYRETPTIELSRMTKTSQYETEYDLDKALDSSINFISNKDLIFDTICEVYYFSVDGKEMSLPHTLSFDNAGDEGEATYKIVYKDQYGFIYEFDAVLFRTVLNVTKSSDTTTEVYEDVDVTKKNFKVDYSTNAECRYSLNGKDDVSYNRNTIVKLDGDYLFTVEDIAGNVAYYHIIKDSVVDYEFKEGNYGDTLANGLVTSETNIIFSSLNEDEAYIKYAFVNEEAIDVSKYSTYSKNGKWEFVIADKYGNESNFMFYVITHEINYFDYYEPKDYEFSDIWRENTETGKVSQNAAILTSDDGRKHFVFEDEGTYSVLMNSLINGSPVTFTVTISNEVPDAKLEGVEENGYTIQDVTISKLQKGDTVYVYKDGVLISETTISLNNQEFTISDEGKYEVVVENQAGNKVTYSFTKKHVANKAGSALVIILLGAIITGLIIGLFYRKRSRVDK